MAGIPVFSGADVRIDYCTSARGEFDWLTRRVRVPDDTVQVLFCHYREPAVIFGLSQRPDTGLQQRLDAAGMSWMRRRAGGGTVYAGPWLLGVSVILPASHPLYAMEPVEAYRWFGAAWMAALGSLGCDSRLPDSDTIRASRREAKAGEIDWACYGALGHGELGSAEPVSRKILGIAQIRTRASSTLVAGLNLTAGNWRSLCELLGRPAEQGERLSAVTAALADLIGDSGPVKPQTLARRVESAFVPILRRAVDSGV